MTGRTGALALAASLLAAVALPAGAAEPPPRVLLAQYSGIIVPVAAEFVGEGLARAGEEGFDAFVLQLDTPGGLDPSMRQMIKAIMNSDVPVIVYVHPTGARAASAGVFITMAAHVAAMTPGTNIGAAHPVALPIGGGGRGEEKRDKTLEDKAVNDAAAYLKSIAGKRGRNAEWAYRAVAVSTSIPATEALALNVVDLLADDLEGLLRAVDGRKVPDFKEPLRTAGALVERHEMSTRQRWLAVVSDPNVAMILMSLGAGGIFIEMYNPGLILPGIIGVLCLILAFYSFQTLSASYAGVLLILAGLAFFLLEIKVASYGLLALGGVAATLLGVLMLFQQPLGGVSVSWSVIASSLAGVLAVVAGMSYLVYRAYRGRGTTGREGLIGAEGKVLEPLAPRGRVSLMGEIWEAESSRGDVPAGAEVVVEDVRGLRLKVRPK